MVPNAMDTKQQEIKQSGFLSDFEKPVDNI